MNKAGKKIIAREGLIVLGLAIFYAACLSAAFLFPYATTFEVISIIIIATVVFGYLLYLIIKFTIWAIKILEEK